MASTSSNTFAAREDDDKMPTSEETTSTGGPISMWGYIPEAMDTYRQKIHTVDPFFSSDHPMMGSNRESTSLDQGEGSKLGSNRESTHLEEGEGSNLGSKLVSTVVDEEGANSDEGDGDQANNEQDLPGKEKAQDASRVKNKKKGATKKKKSGNTRRGRP